MRSAAEEIRFTREPHRNERHTVPQFSGHAEVRCGDCKSPLDSVEARKTGRRQGEGRWMKSCPECCLTNTYDIRPHVRPV